MSATAVSPPAEPKPRAGENGNRRVRILKVVVNAGVGQSGTR